MAKIKFSVVVPVFDEAESITELCDRLHAVFDSLQSADTFEVIFVDDGSTDSTPKIIGELSVDRPYIKCIRFRTNIGKSLALTAGFKAAKGDVVITIDGDLQDNPEDIPQLVAMLDSSDVVVGRRNKRQDKLFRKLGSKIFNSTVASVTGLAIHDLNCGLKVFKKGVVSNLCIYGQYHRYIPVEAHLLGYRVTECPVKNDERKYGSSKYKTFRYQGAFDLLSLVFIHKYGLRPLHFFGVVSMLIAVPGILALLWFISQQFLFLAGFGDEFKVLNRPLFALSLTAIMTGTIIFLTGLVCDFILHHKVRDRIEEIIDQVTDKTIP